VLCEDPARILYHVDESLYRAMLFAKVFVALGGKPSVWNGKE
jgi:hypothetical protein